MKILHSALMKNFTSGIVNQMYDEFQSAKDLEIDFDVKIFSPSQMVPSQFQVLFEFYDLNTSNSKIKSWIEYRKAYYSWLESKDKEVDCYILRYSAYDPFQYLFIQNSNKPVYLVHHTKELDELKTLGIKGKILSYIDKIFGNKSIKVAKGIIGVTNEIIEYERLRIGDLSKKGILYSNGIKIKTNELKDRRINDIPEILFVASYFYDWHGLDLLIDAVKKNNQNFVIHIVGKVNDVDYAELLKNKKFKYHGVLSHDEILTITEQCWIGLGSLALFRKNMNQACTLKVREYLAMGLPVYSGYNDVFPIDFEFYRFDSIDIDKILDYALQMRKYQKNDIMQNSIQFISKDSLLKKLSIELDM